MAQLSTMFYGIAILAAVAGLIGLFLAGVAGQDTTLTDYDNSSTAYNNLNSINDQVRAIEQNVTQIKEKSGVLDVLGGFFSSGYQSVLLIAKGTDTVEAMADQAATDSGLGAPMVILKTLGISLLIIAVIMIIVSAIVKPGSEKI